MPDVESMLRGHVLRLGAALKEVATRLQLQTLHFNRDLSVDAKNVVLCRVI